jgi:hypothetical protein
MWLLEDTYEKKEIYDGPAEQTCKQPLGIPSPDLFLIQPGVKLKTGGGGGANPKNKLKTKKKFLLF